VGLDGIDGRSTASHGGAEARLTGLRKRSTMLLKGKVAVVTGSGQGLGRAYARALAGAGARVIVNATTEEHVAAVLGEIRREGGAAEGCIASVASMEGGRQVVQRAIDAFGRIDILVNNAGIYRLKALAEMNESEFDDVIAVNLKGSFACARQAVPHMIEQGSGRIISMASGAIRGRHQMTGYAASKAGIVAMTLTWAQELGRHGITCNVVRAAARTRGTEPLIEMARQAARERGEQPPSALDLGFHEPEAAAPLVVFLATDEAGWINGQLISIDGPRLAVWAHTQPASTAIMPGGWTAEALIEHFKATLGTQLDSYGWRRAELGGEGTLRPPRL